MRISMVCEPAPVTDRLNEDACAFWSDEQTGLAAVIDGATQRIRVPLLYPSDNPAETGARFAAQMTKSALCQTPDHDPDAMLLAANATVRQQIERVTPLEAEQLVALAPEHADLLTKDARLIRLLLPVCVATVLKFDLTRGKAQFAHAGDTALFAFHNDGRITQLTEDQMAQHDRAALHAAIGLQHELDAAHLSDVLDHERARQIDLANGLYHNYVDRDGTPDRTVGVGVINGLPQLEAYIQHGDCDLTDIQALLLCSDGFTLPAPWDETSEQRLARWRTMRDMLLTDGIAHYYAHLRAIEADDPHNDRYPRFKRHDDASGILLEL